VQRGGSSPPPVILSGAKNLNRNDEILRSAQNDELLRYFCRSALDYRWNGGRAVYELAPLVSIGLPDDIFNVRQNLLRQ
jgi:hypothetical protein